MRSKPAGALLALGALGGALLASAGVLERPPSKVVPPEAVAVVNGTPILRVDHERAVQALADAIKKDGEGAPDPDRARELSRRALDRLIEEELLIQRGIELGLPERDPQIRANLSARVIEMTAAPGAEDPAPDERALRAFFEEERDRFQSPPRRRVAVLFFSAPPGADPAKDADAKRRATEARSRALAGEPQGEAAKLADPLVVSPPDALLPIAKLREYLGDTATRALLDLKEGGVTEPIRGADGYRVVRLLEVRGGELPDFNDVRAQVLDAYRRRQQDERVRALVERRRAEADVVVAKLP